MVVAIIGIMIAIAVPLVGGYPESRQLSAEADNIESQIAYARLVAVSSGKPVELRFYLAPVVETRSMGSDEYYRSSQVLIRDEQGRYRPDGRAQKFGGKTIVLDDPTYSSIMASEPQPPDPNATAVQNRAVARRSYQAIRFLPDGSTNLGRGGDEYWTLTLVNWDPSLSSSGSAPRLGPGEKFPNFVTIQIDPFTAKIRRYEPGR